MTESLIGSVPTSWTTVPLGEVCKIQAGLSKRVGRESPDGIPIVMIGDIGGGRILLDDLTRIILPDHSREDRYSLRQGDIVCARTGDLGRSALVTEENSGWFVSSGCLRLRVDPLVMPRYLVHYLEHPAVREWVRSSSTGSVIPNLSVGTLAAMPVVVPPLEEQAIMVDILDKLGEKIAVHEEIVRTTTRLREAILRLLLSGTHPPFTASSR